MVSKALLVTLIASFIGCGLAASNLELLNSQFEAFKVHFNKNYSSAEEHAMRFEIFSKNLQEIKRFNAEESQSAGYKLGVNHLTDYSQEEYSKLNGLRMPKSGMPKMSDVAEQKLKSILEDGTENVAQHVDWRAVGGRVSPVKDQGNCGSCWAFASTGVLEGQEQQVFFKNQPLSEQELVDCSKQNNGCRGGLMYKAFDDIHTIGGIEPESVYPYVAKQGTCQFDTRLVLITDSAGAYLQNKDEDSLMRLVARYGPVSVGINADDNKFQFYKSGVYYNPSCDSDILDHAVLIVGYGTDPEGGDYWLVKNSWGPKWGENGYVKMARNKNNHCGIASIPTIAFF